MSKWIRKRKVSTWSWEYIAIVKMELEQKMSVRRTLVLGSR